MCEEMQAMKTPERRRLCDLLFLRICRDDCRSEGKNPQKKSWCHDVFYDIYSYKSY